MISVSRFVSLFAATGLCFAAACSSISSQSDPSIVQSGFQRIVSDASEKVFPSVVFIHVVSEKMGSGSLTNVVALGSGVLISADGELLTNNHVIDKAKAIRCQLFDGREFTARVIGTDKDIDLALLKLNLPEKTAPLPFSEIAPEIIPEGEFVMAMGAPWGMNRSVSMGIIGCASRYLSDSTCAYSLWYQTDAAISPGNSGGPLVDTRGRIVGINTLGILFGGNTGFSLPSPTILTLLPRFREYGNANWAWFGLHLQPLNDFLKNIHFDFTDGIMVAGTDHGSPARLAGFLPDDRIIQIDGVPVTAKNVETLPAIRLNLAKRPFNKNVVFTVVRAGKELQITCAPIPKGKVEGDEANCPRWGLTAKTINRFNTPNLFFQQKTGVYIFGALAGGNARQAGLAPSDIILDVDGQPVTSLKELSDVYQKVIERKTTTKKVVINVRRNMRNLQFVLDFTNNNEQE